MSYRDFMHSTMTDIRQRIEVYREDKENEAKELEFKAWLSGLYVRNAITSSFNKKSKYPDNPLKVKEVVVTDMVLTEEEKAEWSQRWLNKLTGMMEKNKRYKELQGE